MSGGDLVPQAMKGTALLSAAAIESGHEQNLLEADSRARSNRLSSVEMKDDLEQDQEVTTKKRKSTYAEEVDENERDPVSVLGKLTEATMKTSPSGTMRAMDDTRMRSL